MDRISLSLRAALLQSVGEEDKTGIPEQPQVADEKFMGSVQGSGLDWGQEYLQHIPQGPLFYWNLFLVFLC